MITDIIDNKDLNQVVAKLFMRGRKLNISTVFMIANLFHNSKTMLGWTVHIFALWKFQRSEGFNKSHLIIDQILNFKTLWIFTKKGCIRIFVFSDLVIDTIVASDNPSIFRKNILEEI